VTGSEEMSEETVLVEICPHCRGAHTYRLNVERAVRLKVPSLSKKRETASNVEINQIFVCPLKDQTFEASFYLQDTSFDRIRAVSVIGLAEVTCD
jgi:hypothetical protein